MYSLKPSEKYSNVTMCTMDGDWMHRVEESTNLVQQLTVLGVCVACRKSLFVHRYNHINLSEALNKIREENNRWQLKKKVIMSEEAQNKALANGKELNEEKKNKNVVSTAMQIRF